MISIASLRWIIITILVLLAYDAIVLGIFLRTTWSQVIQTIQGSVPMTPRLPYGMVVYLCLAIAMYTFLPTNTTYTTAFLFGSMIYAVFDFTMLTIFSKYPLSLAIMDTVWGGILVALTLFTVRQIEQVFPFLM